MSYAVFDNVTNRRVSQTWADEGIAIYHCRGLNTPQAGGRYHVRTQHDDGGWYRDDLEYVVVDPIFEED